jgi:hypothetical protein
MCQRKLSWLSGDKDQATIGRTPARERDEHGREKPNSGRHPTPNETEKGASIGGAQNRKSGGRTRTAEHSATKKSTPNRILASATNETSRGTKELTPENEL